MNQDTRSLIAVGLSVGVFIVWYGFFSPKPTKDQLQNKAESAQTQPANVQKTEPTNQTQKPEEKKITENVDITKDPQGSLPIKTTTIESDLYKVELTNDGGVPIFWEMKKFVKSENGKTVPVNLINGNLSALNENFSYQGIPQKPRYNLVEATSDRVVYAWRSKNIDLTKTYQFNPKTYLLELTVSIRNLSENPIETGLTTEWSIELPKQEKKGMFSFLKGPQNEFKPIYFLDNKLSYDPVAEKEGKLFWAGIEDRYFMSAIVPRGHGDSAKVSATRTALPDDKAAIETTITIPAISVAAGSAVERKFSVYVGPKEMESLKSSGSSLEKAIDYGWFSFIAVPILYLLKFFYGLIHNYGVAIIILTIFVKLLLHPLSRHSMKSMKGMQTLQPKLKELKEKYKDNKEKLNMETMALFRAHKVNPMGGCLPMALQLPIYIALYKVLWNSIELYRAPFVGFYKDLSAPDPYFIMPIILGVAMWLQQKLTPSASTDPAQAKMMQIMPIMFTAFMLFLPSGLVLYILVNTVMGVAQQYMSNNDIRMRDVLRGKFKPQTAVK